MRFWRRWRDERAARDRAAAYVAGLLSEPSEDDVAWLATESTAGDADHARWEWRYARRALGMLAAQRDALDDRTASAVSAALSRALRHNTQIAPERREVAARQFNVRLAAYGEALLAKGGPEGTSDRLGRVLLGFAGNPHPSPAQLSAAGARVTAHLLEASDRLRAAFGAASLPDDVAPSAMARH